MALASLSPVPYSESEVNGVVKVSSKDAFAITVKAACTDSQARSKLELNADAAYATIKTTHLAANVCNVRRAAMVCFEASKPDFERMLASYHTSPAVPFSNEFVEKFLEQYGINLAIVCNTNLHGLSSNTCTCDTCPFVFEPYGVACWNKNKCGAINNCYIRAHVNGEIQVSLS